MSEPRSLKLFGMFAAGALIGLAVFILFLYQYDQHQEIKRDIANGYGTITIGIVTTLTGKYPTANVQYQYHGYTFDHNIGNPSPDSLQEGTRVRLLISSLHPGNEGKYIGVDTIATKEAGVLLIKHHE